MRIGIQVLSLKPGQVGGQGVFVRRLLRHLVPQLGDERLVLFLRPDLAVEPGCRTLCAHPMVEVVVENPERHYGDGYAAWNLRLLERAALEVVYFPLSFFYPRPLPLPVVLHVPDIQHEYFPEYFPPEQLAWRRQRIPESVALADAVITYTNFSAGGLREKLGADPNKLHVIPAGGFLENEIYPATGDARATSDLAGGHIGQKAWYKKWWVFGSGVGAMALAVVLLTGGDDKSEDVMVLDTLADFPPSPGSQQ